MTNQEIIQDAREAAEAAVDQGFFVVWRADSVEELGALIHGNGGDSGAVLAGVDSDEDWLKAWRGRLFELGLNELCL